MATLKDAISEGMQNPETEARRPSVLFNDENKRKASIAQLTSNTTGE